MLYIGSDHRGVQIKKDIILFLEKNKISYVDHGVFDETPSDYPDIAQKVARSVARNSNNKGILICGSGTGMQIAANRHKSIRAVAGFSKEYVIASRKDNNSNIICFSSQYQKIKNILILLNLWFKTPFSGFIRHVRRIKKIDRI